MIDKVIFLSIHEFHHALCDRQVDQFNVLVDWQALITNYDPVGVAE